MLDFKVYIKQIIKLIERIESSIPSSMALQEFQEDILLSDATLMRVHFIGESMNNIPYSFKKKYKEVPWRKFVTIRHIIGHKYMAVRYKVIWDLIKNHFPKLKEDLQKILFELERVP